jgi:hypothetical protein
LLSGSTELQQDFHEFSARRYQLTMCFIPASPSNANQSLRISKPGKNGLMVERLGAMRGRVALPR